MEDFNFGGKSSFNGAMEAILGGSVHGVVAGANAAMQSGINAHNLAGGNAVARSITGGDSVMSWVSSDRPSFHLNMLFLAINPEDDPRTNARDLMNFVYPTGDPNGILYAPLGYVASYGNAGVGCVAVRIGRWFQTPRLFVVTSVEITVSQRTDKPGVPLYVGASVSFEAMRTLVLSEVRSMFLG